MTDTPDTADTAEPDPLDAGLATCVAEMLATPQLACHRRKCRRGNSCRYHVVTHGVPACVANFSEDQQDIFLALYLDAFYVRQNRGGFSLVPPEGADRELRDAALEVVRQTLPRGEWRAFARRLRMRQEKPVLPAASPDAYEAEKPSRSS
jgi:hypothetical protein